MHISQTGFLALAAVLVTGSHAQTISDARGFLSANSSGPNTVGVTVGVPGFAMLVTGSGFTSSGLTRSPRLYWIPSSTSCPNSACELDTFFFDNNTLQVDIPGYLVALADAGAKIQIANYPYGTRSSAFAFPVNAAMQAVSSLPPGAVGSAYSSRLFKGGTAPYIVALGEGAGAYPAGLTPDSNGNLAGTPASAGTYNFSPRVLDAWNTIAQGSFTLIIGAAGTAVSFSPATLPNAVVGTAYTATLTGSGGVAPYTFAVETGQLPPGLTLSTSGAISGTPTTAGSYDFGIRVTASNSATALGSRTILVSASPSALSFTPLSLPNGVTGQAYSQTLTGVNGTAPYTFSVASGSLPPGITISSAGVIGGAPTTAGTFNFTVKVADSASNSATAALSLVVTSPPSTLSFTPAVLPAGSAGLSYTAALTGAGGKPPYTYALETALPQGLALSASGVISGVPRESGTFYITIRMRDDAGASGSGDATLTIAEALRISAAALPAAQAFQSYSYQLEAAGGQPPYIFLLTTGRPPSGLVLNASTGVISGTPDEEGSAAFTVTVRDSAGATSAAPFTITVAPPPPRITTADLPAGVVGSPYSSTLTAAGGSPPFQWTAVSGPLPAGLNLAATGVVSGVPAESGSFPFTVTATDSGGRVASAILQLLIRPAPLTISTGTLPPTAGGDVSIPFVASGGAPPYNWSVIGGALPPGLALSARGLLSGHTTVIGTFDFRLAVTDAKDATAARDYSLRLTPAPLVILTKSLPPATASEAYSAVLAGEGGTPPHRWTASGLPAGLTLSASGTLSGAPSVFGSFRVSVTLAESGAGSASAAYELTVAPPPLVIETESIPPAAAGVRYTFTFAASGGVKPYNWLIVGGALPGGLVMSSDGVFSGVPQSGGSVQLAVVVSDSRGVIARKEIAFEVQPRPLAITTASLPGGTVGRPYSQSVSAQGGVFPYTWSGALPAGFVIDERAGTISGTPAGAGPATFAVTVSDSAGASAASSFTVVFSAPLSAAAAPPVH